MNKISEKTYIELYKVLKIQEEVFEGKIPQDITEKIKNIALESNLKIELDEDNLLDSISKEAFCIYVYLYTKYLLNEEEKTSVKKILKDNEAKYQKELAEKYNPNDIFKNSNTNPEEETKKTILEDNSEKNKDANLIIYKETIFNKIKRIIKRTI